MCRRCVTNLRKELRLVERDLVTVTSRRDRENLELMRCGIEDEIERVREVKHER